ncbi:SDR family NAD(P)-dependent oxidoreductase [Enemella evansiae]|uniref:Oxidoreductase n=1 Tax=Enemella evansiae TaxID=2016499 RepID=A0A255GBV5_9ACTN|nr:SDR family NAD(P)-dependent oxidoreductase [Enemella evansiae]PFG66037.1 NADP-dependent 3-hydroxy acid dehydrogenase YdfG [Propionibacteriaceae bacterium ES.041]OYN99717.1 oxidoreductase [Enemella evansiae]OYO00179.1 oxidoreductase [Enemella evansiae]OYO04662.1 oxidoreductase [Enemella evansiae]OYO11763.1 oxidoreductase [Enemella evansiae]
MDTTRTAVVTGASSGIGAATARTLAELGFKVICAARRTEKVAALAEEIGGIAVTCDVTSDESVAELAKTVGDRVDLLVNNAGGALGLEPVAEADLAAWQAMYDSNVLGSARVTKALLPAVEAAGGQIVFITSVAADGGYEGGAGYCGVKAAERSIVQSMRLECFDKPVRIAEVVPGMVKTDFSLVRFGGDAEKADKVYAGVVEPLVAEDIAECIGFIAERPGHVNIDRLVVRPRSQPAQHKVHRV